MNYHNWLGIFQLKYLKNGKNTNGACESKSVSLKIVCCIILTGDGNLIPELLLNLLCTFEYVQSISEIQANVSRTVL